MVLMLIVKYAYDQHEKDTAQHIFIQHNTLQRKKKADGLLYAAVIMLP